MLFKALLVACLVSCIVTENLKVVFVGDSITQMWSSAGRNVFNERYVPLGAKNVGVGGDKTENTIDRIDNKHLIDGIKAKVAVLMIGTNNLYGTRDSDEEIARQVKVIIGKLQDKLNAKVLLLGVLPRGQVDACARIEHINNLISKYDNGKEVRFLDMKDKFETGRAKLITKLYQPDKLHLVEAGYRVWADTMEPLLKEMLK